MGPAILLLMGPPAGRCELIPTGRLTMIEIKEVLRRWSAQQSLHPIARETSLDRQTVRRYVGPPRVSRATRSSTTKANVVRAIDPSRGAGGWPWARRAFQPLGNHASRWPPKPVAIEGLRGRAQVPRG